MRHPNCGSVIQQYAVCDDLQQDSWVLLCTTIHTSIGIWEGPRGREALLTVPSLSGHRKSLVLTIILEKGKSGARIGARMARYFGTWCAVVQYGRPALRTHRLGGSPLRLSVNRSLVLRVRNPHQWSKRQNSQGQTHGGHCFGAARQEGALEGLAGGVDARGGRAVGQRHVFPWAKRAINFPFGEHIAKKEKVIMHLCAAWVWAS